MELHRQTRFAITAKRFAIYLSPKHKQKVAEFASKYSVTINAYLSVIMALGIEGLNFRDTVVSIDGLKNPKANATFSLSESLNIKLAGIKNIKRFRPTRLIAAKILSVCDCDLVKLIEIIQTQSHARR